MASFGERLSDSKPHYHWGIHGESCGDNWGNNTQQSAKER